MTLKDRLERLPTDSAEAIDADTDCHCEDSFLPISTARRYA
jgi:hypothetical protein